MIYLLIAAPLNKASKDFLPFRSRPIIHILFPRNPPARIQICQRWINNLCLSHKLVNKVQCNRLEPWEPSSQQSLRPRIPSLLILWIRSSLWEVPDRGLVGDGEVEASDHTTDGDRHGQVMSIRITPRLVGKVLRSTALSLPAGAEPEVEEEDTDPDEEDEGADNGDEPVEDDLCAGIDHDEGDAGEEGGDHDSKVRDSPTVGPANPFRRPAVLGEREHHPGGDIEIRVCRRDNRGKDDCVHVIRSALHPGLQEHDRKWCVDHSTTIVHQSLVVIRYNAGQEENREDVKEGNADEDSVDSFGNMFVRVTGFGGGDPREFGSSVGKADRDEDREEGLETALEGGTLHMPVVDSEGLSTDCSGVGENARDDEDDDGDDF